MGGGTPNDGSLCTCPHVTCGSSVCTHGGKIPLVLQQYCKSVVKRKNVPYIYQRITKLCHNTCINMPFTMSCVVNTCNEFHFKTVHSIQGCLEIHQ